MGTIANANYALLEVLAGVVLFALGAFLFLFELPRSPLFGIGGLMLASSVVILVHIITMLWG